MKIKSIEICGFKSFLDKINLDFPGGITAVVGPNGCGKSNVVDAIRWVLGEQSPRHLRGKSMEDVIFNGSETHKPLGMAEVTMNFTNENGHAGPDYLDYTEIGVTRRLFRSGESEYYINKTPCRLKDITDLFLGTGVGHRAYSILEQGRMDFILNAKPEERRVLVEEAAGITKYKDRKAAALRKMESTHQNLQRLKDVIGEIRRQMNSLNRQAKKAERYKMFREEMRGMEIGQAAQTCRNLLAQKDEMQSALESLRDREIAAQAAIQELDAATERIKVNLMDLERVLTVHQERYGKNEGEIQSCERQLELSAHERENLQRQVLRAKEEIGKLQQQKDDAEREIQTYEGVRQDLDGRIAQESEFLGGKEEILLVQKSRLAEAEQALSQAKNEIIDLLTRQAHLRNSVMENRRRLEEFSRRRERIAREKEDAAIKLEETRARISRECRQLDDSRNRRARIEEERQRQNRLLQELHASLAAVEEELRAVKERLSTETSRLNSLLELQRNFEGYQEGVRSILLKRQAQGPVQNGIYGLVEDVLETEPEYELAVESVLGERLQHIIVQDHQEGVGAIEYLKAHGSGRSSFIPLHVKHRNGASPSVAEGVTPLLNVVKVRDEFSQLAFYLFEDVWIVPTLQDAIALWNRNSVWKTLVTLEGEVLHPSGVLTGGSKEQIGSGTFHRKREIRDLTRSTEELRSTANDLEKKRDDLAASIREAENAVEESTRSLHGEELQIVSNTKELDQHQGEERQWRQRIEILEAEEAQLAEDEAGVHEGVGEAEGELAESGRLKDEKEEELKRGESAHQSLREEIEGLLTEVTEAKVRLSSLQEKREGLEQNLARARRSSQELEALLARRGEEVEECLGSIRASESQENETKATLLRCLAEHQELQARVEEKKEALRAERDKLDSEEANWKKKREVLQEVQQEKNTLSMKLMETDLNCKHLLAGVEERHRLSAEDLLSRGEDRDYFAPEVEARLQELKSIIDSMGEVNLLAIQEYEEEKTRLEFLTEQETDLIKSLEALDQAIKKINRTSRKRFAATFEAVNEKFRELFTGLFNGGKAELILCDEANLLETGVDIVVQPPGKKLQNVNLLSGGEKALTAVALIFSLFLINPSPFCLMDEVDAPLDDANIGRFNKLIRDLSEKYQFIVVTHNKRTMEMANTLYGITMEQPGISKLVSVRLN